MEEKPVRRVRKRGVRRLLGYVRAVILVVLVSFGLILDAVVSAIHRPFQGKKNIIIFTLLIVGLVTGMAYGYGWYQSMSDDGGLREPVTKTIDYPAESTVPVDKYDVAANMPKTLSLGTIGAEGPIQPVSLDQNNKIASPNNVHVAGWYVNSAKPGEMGLSIIKGHLQGKYSKGLFYDLAKLKPGDEFTVTYGDGHIVSFTAVTVQTVSIRDADAVVAKHNPEIGRQLNLIEVTNANDTGTPASNERVIVTAAAQ